MRDLRTITTCLATVAILALSTALTARAAEGDAPAGKPKHRPPPGEYFIPHAVVQKLALTADQQPKYDALVTQFQQDAAKWMKDNNFDPQKFRADMQAAHQAKDHAKVKELMGQRQGLTDLGNQYRDKFKALLTDDQKKKLDELKSERPQRPGKAGKAGEQAPPPAAPAQQ